jgi:NAD(P)H dehydrogenase (quinone)
MKRSALNAAKNILKKRNFLQSEPAAVRQLQKVIMPCYGVYLGSNSLMPKVLVFYYSRTGRTEKMANAVAEGARAGGSIEVALEYHIQADDLSTFDAIIVGAPTYHHEMPMGIKRLLEEAAEKNINLKGKTGAAFGSYGWSGEAPRLVLEVMKYKFEMQVPEQPLLARDEPSPTVLKACGDLGKRISEILIRGA